MANKQMELGLGKSQVCPSANRRAQRSSHAQWWFQRMRRAVEGALEWQPAPAPRPEQIWFAE